MVSKDAVPFHGGTSGSNPSSSAGESVLCWEWATPSWSRVALGRPGPSVPITLGRVVAAPCEIPPRHLQSKNPRSAVEQLVHGELPRDDLLLERVVDDQLEPPSICLDAARRHVQRARGRLGAHRATGQQHSVDLSHDIGSGIDRAGRTGFDLGSSNSMASLVSPAGSGCSLVRRHRRFSSG